MFENSTVCHSRRISLLCPVSHGLLVMGTVFFGEMMMILAIFVSVVVLRWEASLFTPSALVS